MIYWRWCVKRRDAPYRPQKAVDPCSAYYSLGSSFLGMTAAVYSRRIVTCVMPAEAGIQFSLMESEDLDT
jgi:hypothetical protein